MTTDLGAWFDLGTLHIHFSFMFDTLCRLMLFIILFVSFCVHMYACEYMREDPSLPRFMAYLSLFTFFMCLLVAAGNLPLFFVGWEGVGLCSYLLINFWHTRLAANKAAVQAVIVNKIGDVCVLLSGAILFYVFGSLDFDALEIRVTETSYYLEAACVFLVIGAAAKSAQVGLHTWLPDAMEGPTPVSALIHAATMVTAGVFLLLRCSVIVEFSPDVRTIAVILGSTTTMFGAITATFQADIKRVIAFSTSSQPGYLFLSRGYSNYTLALFHLYACIF
jgi:NADH:ubiquinone oxidoreductase subunit 5 (subunit L)/multisubunit Na+/H+ antiporter MnhA subunit